MKPIQKLLIALLFPLSTIAFNVANAAPTIPLQSGQPVQLSLQGGTFTTSYYIDVGAQTQQLRVTLSEQGNSDADVYLRFGTPFSDTTFLGAPVDLELINRYAHYRSASPVGNESIQVTAASRQPLRAGRWYLAVVNATNLSENITLAASAENSITVASIQLDFNNTSDGCEIAPWSDATAATPTGSNPGTTLGQQRRNALQRAADLLSTQLASPIAVKVQACWKDLGGDNNGAVLARAGPNNLVLDDPSAPAAWVPVKYTWYAITEAIRLGGASQCGLISTPCSEPDIVATFNTQIGSPNVIGGTPWYYGYDAAGAGNNEDFVSIAMHEMTHGLGFIGLVNEDPESAPVGARFTGNGDSGYDGQLAFDDIFDTKIAAVDINTNAVKPFLGIQTTNADRYVAMTSGSGLRWSDSEANMSISNAFRGLPSPMDYVRLYAPCAANPPAGQPCATKPGSTLSHTDTFAHTGDLMGPSYVRADRTMGLSLPMLHAIGWSNVASTVPSYTQPIPSNWFDRTHSGHGVDFQLGFRDAVGDVYFLIFYTYDSTGAAEWYIAQGRLIDGVFIGGKDSNGHSLLRVTYNPTTQTDTVDPAGGGDVVVDFNQAANSPQCRNADRNSATALAVMNWSILGESDQWCIEPILPLSAHASPDYNGHWYSGSSGWGMEILEFNDGSGAPSLVVELYYPDGQGRSRWATASSADFSNGQVMTLKQVTGYCRLCTPPASLPTVDVGTIALTLTQPTREGTPSGSNRVTLNVTFPGTAAFTRSNSPITLLSAPTGQ